MMLANNDSHLPIPSQHSGKGLVDDWLFAYRCVNIGRWLIVCRTCWPCKHFCLHWLTRCANVVECTSDGKGSISGGILGSGILQFLNILLFLSQQLFQVWQWFCCGWSFYYSVSMSAWHIAKQFVALYSDLQDVLHKLCTGETPMLSSNLIISAQLHHLIPANQQLLCHILFQVRFCVAPRATPAGQTWIDCGNSMLHFFQLVWNTN